ncbi:branched-chain amino acid ABC transporter permease [Cognatishimia sp. 1_MG-2023]|uniref:branched-chain amino acid ABC transporter permease n=1 Tax=Cognatishimia sp. 1_MG-2023 TaxID=3062642 RepID=UPI0026E3395F|nr:branched-chain amino acid ABC transporter permease [Cognatishimia sp. 1_MG-2023]MDO6728232.1 branched-chain amino acid ABC transporter permease [Cognatishimia sp. 1_MG-2023]
MSRLTDLQKNLLILVAVLSAIAMLPLFVTQRYFLGEIVLFMIWASVAVQWNVLLGHAGVFSLGQMLFFAIGAYAVGMMGVFLDMSPWMSMPIGAVIAAVAALVIGLACLRLETAYVALLTFAIVFMVSSLISTDAECFLTEGGLCTPLFGGGNGFSGFDDLGFRKMLKGKWILGNYFVVLAVLAVSLCASILVIHGRLGLAFRSLGDSRIYAAARGINRTQFHIIAFVITAFFTGLTGAVYAAHFRFAGPSLFEFSNLVFILAMIVVGGLKTTWGPVLGAALMMVVVEIAKGWGDVQNTLIGIILILFVLLLPKGIAGTGANLLRKVTSKS